MIRVAALHTYPIKGCRGHAVAALTVDALGVVGDRRLMVVDDDGRFVSQREAPSLARLTPTLTNEHLEVRASAGAPLAIALDPDGPTRRVKVWGGPFLAHDQGDTAADWFTGVLGFSCRLVRFGAASDHPIDPEFSPRPGAQTTFNDGFPLLVVTDASLDDLNRRLPHPVPMNRFRPNVVLTGADAWAEDQWKRLDIGDVTLDLVKPCARCVVTTTDQESGARDPEQEPLRTLAGFRNQRPFGAIFGQNAVPRASGSLRVDDAARVT